MKKFIFDILGYPLLVLFQLSCLKSSEADVLCTGLPNGGRIYCPVACCIREEGSSRYSYYCCGSAEGPGPGWIYRERPDGRNNRITYSSVRIDWWNSLLISLALSIILSVLLSLLCCFICARRRR
uniref:Candidate secreted effector n=1 Tax=Meloidogyne incognita TaxID=6306 RepID=A0A914KXD2_MELIC